MRVQCEDCEKDYDDAESWTICPHNPLHRGAGDQVCKKHDLFDCGCLSDLIVQILTQGDLRYEDLLRRVGVIGVLLPKVGLVKDETVRSELHRLLIRKEIEVEVEVYKIPRPTPRDVRVTEISEGHYEVRTELVAKVGKSQLQDTIDRLVRIKKYYEEELTCH